MNNIEKEPEYSVYPDGAKLVGEAGEGTSLKIFIREYILNDIDSYLSTDKTKELGGVLLGNVYKDNEGKIFVVIDDIVIANFTVANISRLTFTHETWNQINQDIEKNHKDKIIVGWFHSHPGHTVFLSSYDKFIHENYFNLKFMVAYVYDPVLQDRGFFFWRESNLDNSSSYYIYDNKKLNSDFKKKFEEPEMPPKKNNITVFLIIVLLLFNIILAGFLIFQHFQIDKENKTNEDFKSRLSELKNEITNLNAKLEAAKRTNDSINYNSGENVIKYQVKPGDTLKKIATEFYNDPEKVNLLIRFNNLKDEYDITTGQVIGIPTNN